MSDGSAVASGADIDLAPDTDALLDGRRRHVTMREVAAAAGVSVSAVSYVLNESRPVSADKRERVLKAIADLEYVPNGMAQALRRTRSGLLGMILPDLSTPPYGLLAKHVEAVARAAGYLTVVCNSAGDEDALTTAYVRGLQGLRIDGLILRTTRAQHELLPAVIQADIPAVLLMSDPPTVGRKLDRVLVDNALGVRLAVAELARAGHTRIGLVSTQDLSRPTLVRLQGFLQGMEEAGLHADMGHVRIGAANASAGEAMTADLLAGPNRPTALIVAQSRLSLGALRALNAHRLHVPDDLSLVVFGRRDFFDLYPTDLTIVELPMPEMASTAARLLIERLEHGNGANGSHADLPPRQVILEPTLHRGASVGPPASAKSTV
ncbi:MAG: LacI family DNA-binding transcriptional regulator [Chloroflexota bacterium]